MAARRADSGGRRSWLAVVFGMAVLAAVGFGAGMLAGVLWKDPGLVASYALGETEEIAWGAGAEPPEPDADAETPAVAAPPPLGSNARPPEAASAPAAEPAQPAQPAAAARRSPPRGLAVQVGAFAQSDSAEALARSLREEGFPVYVFASAEPGDARWRVRVGPLATRAEAERTAARLKRERRLPTWILDEGGG